MARAAARGLHDVGQGPPRADALPAVGFTGTVGGAVRAMLDGTRRSARGAARAAASGDGTRRRAARALLERDARLDSGGDGAAPSVVGRPRRLRDVGTTPRRVRGHERRGAAVHPAGDQRPRLCPDARTAAGFDVRRLVPDDELRQWADRVSGWNEEGRRVLVYFNNDLGGHAIRNAQKAQGAAGDRVA